VKQVVWSQVLRQTIQVR